MPKKKIRTRTKPAPFERQILKKLDKILELLEEKR